MARSCIAGIPRSSRKQICHQPEFYKINHLGKVMELYLNKGITCPPKNLWTLPHSLKIRSIFLDFFQSTAGSGRKWVLPPRLSGFKRLPLIVALVQVFSDLGLWEKDKARLSVSTLRFIPFPGSGQHFAYCRISSVQPAGPRLHAAQGGYECGPTQNHKFT